MFKPIRCLASASIWTVRLEEQAEVESSLVLHTWDEAEAKYGRDQNNKVKSRIVGLAFHRWPKELQAEIADVWSDFDVWGVQAWDGSWWRFIDREGHTLAGASRTCSVLKGQARRGELDPAVASLLEVGGSRVDVDLFRFSLRPEALWRHDLREGVDLAIAPVRTRFERV